MTIQAQILQLLKEMQVKYNLTIVLITHDLGVVAQTCEKVMVMYAGEAIEYGSSRGISLRPPSATLTPRGCSMPFPSWMRTPSVWRPLRG